MSDLLSICIPTFNRCSFLDAFVSQWIDEIEKLELRDRISIDIVDNFSADLTPEILEKLRLSANERKVKLNYSINSRNIGIGGSLSKLIKRSKSDYIWTMGDDDSIDFSMLGSVVKLLEDTTNDVVFLKTLPVFKKLDYDSFMESNDSGSNSEGEIEIRDFSIDNKNILEIDKYVGFVSSVIVRNDILNRSLALLDRRYIENYYYMKLYNYQAVSLAQSVKETVGSPIVLQNCVDGSYFWNDADNLRKCFVTDLQEVFLALKEGTAVKLTSTQLSLIAKKYFSHRVLLVSLKKHDRLYWSDIRNSKKLTGKTFWWPISLFLLPKVLVNFLFELHQSLKNNKT